MRDPTKSACGSSSRASRAAHHCCSGARCDITTDPRPASRNRLALALAAVPVALHLSALTNYDFSRDELYFIVCGRHPAFGYVDQPPFIPLLAAATQSAGESLWLLRIFAVLFHIGTVLAACAVAREIGGGRTSQILAGLATGTAPLLLGVTATLGTTAVEPVLFTVAAWSALRSVLRDEPRWWIVAGLAAGLALEAKYTIAFFLVAIVFAAAVVGPRELFARVEFWIGCACALAIAAPSVIWQALHGWPFVALLYADAAGKNAAPAPFDWLLAQVVIVTPAFAFLAVAGFGLLFGGARTRFLAVAVTAVFIAFLLLHAKAYYLAGMYPMLFAAGGVAFERSVRNTTLRTAFAVVATLAALVFSPFALPLLPESAFLTYQARVTATLHLPQAAGERHRPAALPQLFADMHGWRHLADRVAAAERSLSPDDRAQAVVYTQNYGEAAAVDVYNDPGIPVVSAHNSYFSWGLHGNPQVFVIVGGDKRDHERIFRDVRLVDTVSSVYAMPYENNLPIFIARDPKTDLTRLWPLLRHND